MSGLELIAGLACSLWRKCVLDCVIVGRVEECPSVDRLLSWWLRCLYIAELIDSSLRSFVGLCAFELCF